MAVGLGGISLSLVSLVILCAQNSLLTILLRYVSHFNNIITPNSTSWHLPAHHTGWASPGA